MRYTHEEHGEVCPAQWEKGKEGMKDSPEGVAKYLKQKRWQTYFKNKPH